MMAAAEGVGIAGPSHQGYSGGGIEEYSDERFISVVAELWELKINPKEFAQMKHEIVQQIYLAFLKDIGVDLEKMNQFQHKFLDTSYSLDDYASALQLLTLSQYMQKYLKLIFNEDSFRLADVINPKPKRSRKYFKMIYEFVVLSEGYFRDIEQIEEEVQNILDHRDKMKSRIEKLKQMIGERKAENTKNEVAREEEKLRLEEKTKMLQDCQEKKIELKRQVDELNLSLAALSTHTNEMELMIMELKEEKERLEGQVIQANEREEINKMKEIISIQKNENQATRDHMTKLQEKLKAVISHKDKVDKSVTLLQEIELEKIKQRDLHTTIEEKRSQISELHEEIKKQEEQNLQLTQQLTSAENKVQNMKQVWELKKKTFDNENKEKKQSLEDLNRNQDQQDIAYKDIMDSIAALEEEIEVSKESMETKNTLITNNYTMMLNMVEEENMDLNKILHEAGETLQEFEKQTE